MSETGQSHFIDTAALQDPAAGAQSRSGSVDMLSVVRLGNKEPGQVASAGEFRDYELCQFVVECLRDALEDVAWGGPLDLEVWLNRGAVRVTGALSTQEVHDHMIEALKRSQRMNLRVRSFDTTGVKLNFE